MSSANLRTQPDYDYQDGKSILKGYRAVRTVEVTLRQLDKLEFLADGALKAGLNEIRSVSLGVAQPDAYKDKARKAAIDNAIHQAQELANGFHRNWGRYIACATMFPTISPAQWADDESRCRPVSAQETYEQAAIQFDDQVDVVFQLEPVDQQPAKQLQHNNCSPTYSSG
ncbi:SIMPL domain-containing protein (plasmid) [Escherichia coli]|nr:SIMPL domain-containing protein [Escherichia coli]MCM1621451.1 SIMPL domain-containing protein [Escherichia coli]